MGGEEIRSSGAIEEVGRKPLLKRLVTGCGIIFGVVVLLLLVAGLWGWGQVRGSLPDLDGEVVVEGLDSPVSLIRDDLGVPSIEGKSRKDVAFGLGYAHAQDRFFQMDLLRRQSSGELAALFGSVLQGYDHRVRFHSFRQQARRIEEALPEETRGVLTAYAAGVNAGFDSLRKPPLEYFLIDGSPEPWREEDSILVLLAMFFFLGDDDGEYDLFLDQLNQGLPPELFAFLTPIGTSWDSLLVGDSPVSASASASAPVPGPEVCSLKDGAAPPTAVKPSPVAEPSEGPSPEPALGSGASNAWVLAGSRTASGEALLAADLHVELTVPILWYRAALAWPGAAGRQQEVIGMTVPGAPLVVVGSNRRVAWAFTNSRADTTDLVRLETAPEDPNSYMGSDGAEPFETVRETIVVEGGEDEILETRWTRWGPVVEEDGALFALRWAAQEEAAVNLNLLAMETADGLEEALEVARNSGLPALNFFVAGEDGRIGWTMAGQFPHRAEGEAGRLPMPWQQAGTSWDRWLEGEEIPRLLDPPSGLLWNANNRTVGGEGLKALGDGNYVLGARAKQIRDGLETLTGATEADMLRVQLDNRALFLERWQGLLLELLEGASCEELPLRCEARELVRDWGGRAAVDSAGYTLVRNFRHAVGETVFAAILQGCGFPDAEEAPPYYDEYGQAEGPLWALISQQPGHLLPPSSATWEELLLEVLDEVLGEDETAPADRTWGSQNRLSMRHLFSGAVPVLGRFLDMPADPLAGDSYMPRLMLSRYGASQRLAVTPGREEEGYFHMPAGQSGHPLSPHYRDGHRAWLEGEATPFLPGPAKHTMKLVPQGSKAKQNQAPGGE